jgi:prepilin-type N-terminal cleavage/methylation domain-containing protein
MAARSRSRAFTLLELLVVIGIIGILIGITLAIGSAVTSGAKQRLTADTIRVLDTTVEAYVKAKGDIPDPWITFPDAQPGGNAANANKIFPIADARNMSDTDTALRPTGHQMINSVGLFMAQAEKVPAAKAALSNLSPKVIKQYSFKAGGSDVTLNTVFDAWGKPMRYVHPAFQGSWSGDRTASSGASGGMAPTTVDSTQFPAIAGAPTSFIWLPTMLRRNHKDLRANLTMPYMSADEVPDSDGARCTGGRPYFYSAGPDGDPSTVEDNIYSTVPAFPAKE